MTDQAIDYSRAVDELEQRAADGREPPGYFELLAIACHKPAKIVRWCRTIDRRVARAAGR